MKTVLAVAACPVMSLWVGFSLVAFVRWNVDIASWPMKDRAGLLGISFLVAAICTTVGVFNKDKL